jgi:hypothetical protein
MSDYETISTCQKSFVVDRCMHATTKAKCRDCLLRCCDACLKDGICYDCRDDKTTEESFCGRVKYARNVHVEKSAVLLVKLLKKTVTLSQAHIGAENATKISCTRITIMIYGFHDNHHKFLHTC